MNYYYHKKNNSLIIILFNNTNIKYKVNISYTLIITITKIIIKISFTKQYMIIDYHHSINSHFKEQ